MLKFLLNELLEKCFQDMNLKCSQIYSSENVDLAGRREKFLRSNFESLSGANEDGNANKNGASSISNQYRHSAVERNAKTIARAQSFRDDEQNKKREELQRRIEETRKKLQNVSLYIFFIE